MGVVVVVLLLLVCGMGSAQFTCFTTPSNGGEFNCQLGVDGSFDAASIEECCVDRNGYFFTGVTASCTPCIVFGWLNGTELTLQEQAEGEVLAIGFIKGGNVQPLTSIDRRNTARFRIEVGGTAMEGANADFTIQTTSFEIIGPDARAPFGLSTFVRIDRVALETAEDFTMSLTGANDAGRAILNAAMDGQFAVPMIRVVIEDTETAELQFTESDYSNVETELIITPVVQLLTDIATDLTVEIVPLNYTDVLDRSLGLPPSFPAVPPSNPRRPNVATSVADFFIDRVSITFPAGDTTTRTVDIRISDDDVNEVEQIFVMLLNVISAIDPNRVDLQSTRNASLGRILDDDPINIGFEQQRYTVSEADVVTGGMMLIPIIKENDQQSEVTFEVLASLIIGSGSTAAQPNQDFGAIQTQRQDFDSDEQVIYFEFELFNDATPELAEEFEIELSLPEGIAGINHGASDGSLFARTTVVIIDDDDVVIGWEQNVTTVNETHGLLELCVSITNLDESQELSPTFRVSLAANTIRGTAADPGDYGALRDDNDIFFDFITDAIRRTCIEVEIADDNFQELVEYFSIQVVPDPFETDFPTNVELEPDLIYVEISDNDFVRIGFTQAEYTAMERIDDVAIVNVAVLEGDLRRRVSVTFSTLVLSSDTATANIDFDSLTREIFFDEVVKIVPVEITINDDNLFEEFIETFTVSLVRDSADPISAVIISPGTATVSIQDDDVVVIGYVPALYSVIENDSDGTVDVGFRLTQGDLTGITAGLAIAVNVSEASFTATAGNDFNFAARTLNFDELNTEFTLTVSIINDDVTEGPEVFFIFAVSSDDRVQIIPDRANVTIIDEDVAVIGFVETAVTVGEEAGPTILTAALLMGSVEREVFVDFITQDGTAVATADYTMTVQLLSFGPFSILNAPVPVSIDITDDDLLELDEIFSASLSLVPTSLIVEVLPSIATVTINDNDPAQIGFHPESYSVSEDGGFVTLTVVLISGRLDIDVEVGFTTRDDTALAGADYVATSQMLILGSTVNVKNVTVPIINDVFFEFQKQFFGDLTLLASDANVTVSPNEARVFIDDDDDIIIGFTQNAYDVNENAGFINVTVDVLDGNLDREVFITLQTSDGTAVSAPTGEPDYEARSIMLTFSPSVTSITVPIRITDDLLLEVDREEFISMLTLLSTALEIILQPASVPITIIDNDRVVIGFEQLMYEVGEGDGSVNVRILVLMGMLRRNVNVSVETQDGTAVAGSDYTNRGALQFTFSQFVTEFDIRYEILNDGIHENTEKFIGVLLTGDDDAILNPNSTYIYILDNDPLYFTFERQMYMYFEDSMTGTVCVNKTGDTTETIQIMIQGDLQPGLGSIDQMLTFAPTDTQICVDFVVQDDNIGLEPPEILTFIITVINSIPGVEIDPYNITVVTIVDEDVPPVILVPPVDLTVVQPEDAVFTCQATGRPRPEITWHSQDDNGMVVDIIAVGGVVNIMEQELGDMERMSTLTIVQTEPRDARNYTCRARNTVVMGEVAASATLTVHVIPQITFTENYTVNQFEPVKFECNATGIPAPYINWYKNGILLNEVIDSRISLSDHTVVPPASISDVYAVYRTLTFSHTKDSDTDTYTCVADNGNVRMPSVAQDFELFVRVAPVILTSPENLTVVAPEDATFFCEATARPGPTINWLRVQEGSRVQLLDGTGYSIIYGATGERIRNSTLTVVRTQPSDAVDYFCRASNIANEDEATAELTVHVVPETLAEDYTVNQFDKVVFQCNATGIPPPFINWYRNGMLLNEVFDSRISISDPIVTQPATSNDVYKVYRTLTFNSTRDDDTDTYTIVADNGNARMPTVSEDFELFVRVAPVILIPPANMTVVAPEDATFFCEATARPGPTIIWLRVQGGRHIQLSDSSEYTIVDGATGERIRNSTVTVVETQPSDTQDYFCRASNMAGAAEATTGLTVHVVPEITFTKDFTVNQFDEVIFECNATGIPAPDINWYRNTTLLNDAFDSRIYLSDPIVTQPADSNDVYEVYRTLALNYTMDDDTDTYTCVADNGNARMPNVTQDFELFVRVAPVILFPPENLTVVAPEDAIFFCEAIARPRPTIVWLRVQEGRHVQIISGADYTIVDGATGERIRNSTLTVVGAQPSDALDYICKASNMAGTENATAELTVHVVPVITFTEDYIVNQFEEVIFECNATGIPAPSINWNRNGILLNEAFDSRISLTDPIVTQPASSNDVYEVYRTLAFNSTRDNDIDTYACVASNQNARMPNVTQDFGLFFAVGPVILTPPENLTVIQPDNASFLCEATARPRPTITWWIVQDGGPVQLLDGTDYTIKDVATGKAIRNSTLTVLETQPSDAMDYVCRASNRLDEVEATAELTVYVVPDITFTENYAVNQSDEVVFECNATGIPAPYINWYRNSVLLNEMFDSRIRLSDTMVTQPVTSNDVYTVYRTLTFEYTRDNDTDTYTCVAGNGNARMPRDTQNFELFVRVAPDILQLVGPEDLTVVQPDKATFFCEATGRPGPNITWWSMQNGGSVPNQLLNGTHYTIVDGAIGERIRSSTLAILETQPSDARGYHCIAENPAGIDQELIQLTVHVVPEIIFPGDNFEYGVDEFQPITFVCQATGIPAPNINWYRKGVLLNEIFDQRISLGTPFDTPPEGPNGVYSVVRILSIDSTTVRDTDTYTCVANNENRRMPNVTQDFGLSIRNGSERVCLKYSDEIDDISDNSCNCYMLTVTIIALGVLLGVALITLIGIVSCILCRRCGSDPKECFIHLRRKVTPCTACQCSKATTLIN